MYLAKTYFTKLSFPGLTMDVLADFCIRYLEQQEVTHTSYNCGLIDYRNSNWLAPLNRYTPYFGKFNSGRLLITESDKVFNLYFSASFRQLFWLNSIVAVFISILFLALKYPLLWSLAPGILMFLWVGLGNYFLLKVNAPKYLKKLRDNIEQDYY